MMRLPWFQYRAPQTVTDAASWLAENPAKTLLLAGGTDLLPNMKRRQQTPATVIGLRGIPELREIHNAVAQILDQTSVSGMPPYDYRDRLISATAHWSCRSATWSSTTSSKRSGPLSRDAA